MEISVYPRRGTCTAIERHDADTVDLHKCLVVNDRRLRSSDLWTHQQTVDDLSGLRLRFVERRLIHSGRTTEKDRPRHAAIQRLRDLGAEVEI